VPSEEWPPPIKPDPEAWDPDREGFDHWDLLSFGVGVLVGSLLGLLL